MTNVIDKTVKAIDLGGIKEGWYPPEVARAQAKAAVAAVLKEQIAWSKTAGYNDFIRIVIRNFGTMNDIEVE